MEYPKITVVTPSYNQGQFIERTILSIINQNYPKLEYIICDGGSTDDTVEIIKKYERHIDYWCSEKDKGQTDAINKGMRRATGDIVCWINSDDVMLPEALNYVGAYFVDNPNIDFVMGSVLEIDKQDYILKCTHTILNKWFFKHGCYNILQQGMFWKRSLFDKIGYLDDSFHACMDLEFTIRLVNNSKFTAVKRTLGAIRIYAETKTAMGGTIWSNDKNEIRERYNGRFLPNKKSIYFVLYAICKILNGIYFSNITFYYRNKKIKVSDLKFKKKV